MKERNALIKTEITFSSEIFITQPAPVVLLVDARSSVVIETAISGRGFRNIYRMAPIFTTINTSTNPFIFKITSCTIYCMNLDCRSKDSEEDIFVVYRSSPPSERAHGTHCISWAPESVWIRW